MFPLKYHWNLFVRKSPKHCRNKKERHQSNDIRERKTISVYNWGSILTIQIVCIYSPGSSPYIFNDCILCVKIHFFLITDCQNFRTNILKFQYNSFALEATILFTSAFFQTEFGIHYRIHQWIKEDICVNIMNNSNMTQS